jgi:hypothetical protein
MPKNRCTECRAKISDDEIRYRIQIVPLCKSGGTFPAFGTTLCQECLEKTLPEKLYTRIMSELVPEEE